MSIYAVAADGSHLRRIAGTSPADQRGFLFGASFDLSPDGASIAYSTCEYAAADSERPHYSYDLVRINVDGSAVTRLTDSRRFEGLPAWSPDGTRIAFLDGGVPFGGARLQLSPQTMTPDGGNVTPVTTGFGALEDRIGIAVFHPPKWSPDGRRLAYAAFVGDSRYDFTGYVLVIRIMAADGWDGTPIVATRAVSGASWSPDGTRIAFAKPDGDGIALFTMAADGSDMRRVAPISPGQPYGHWDARDDPARSWVETVAWSPTGDHILISTMRYVEVFTPDGASVGYAPIAFGGVPVAAWSPDGSRIAVAAPVDAYYTDLVEGFDSEIVLTMAPDGSNVRTLVRANLNDRENGLVALHTERYVAKACSAGVVVEKPANNPGLVHDCETLAGLRDALVGRQVVNWAADVSLHDWTGVTVEGTPPRVTGLTLSLPEIYGDYARLRIQGMIPPALGALTELKRLDLSANRLEGTIPPELGRLSKLEYLDLSHNSSFALWGELPKELGNLTRLQVLNLADNQLEGPIPPEFGRLVNLKTLYLSGNSFWGCMPPELHRVPNNDLATLNMADCEPR